MNQKILFLLLGGLLIIGAFFSPIPYYQKEDLCRMIYPAVPCQPKGWRLAPSLYQRFSGDLQKPVSYSVTPKIVTTISPTNSDQTSNLQTYTNSQYSYSFKYPSIWRISSPFDSGATLLTSQPTTEKAGGDFTPGVASISFFVTTKSKDQLAKDQIGLETSKEEVINNLSATELQGHSGVAGSVYFDTFIIEDHGNGNRFVFTLSTQDYTLQQTLVAQFHQILSTLSLTDQSQLDVSSYTACGCGCCGGVDPVKACIYHAKGDSLENIISADKKASQSSQCAVMGCSKGTTYQYCD